MRPRTFLLLIFVVVLLGAVAVLVFLNLSDGSGGNAANAVTTQTGDTQTGDTADGEQVQPIVPTSTPAPPFELVDVVIAKIDIPVGERIREDLVEIEQRPNTNVALQGQYTFDDPADELLIGSIAKVNIPRGEAILRPMLAINPTDIGAFGSDLSLYVDQGKVAVAFPIDPLSGAAFAMRPGDFVDVMMTLSLVELDKEFNTAFPNFESRINLLALEEGQSFLFEPGLQGRLELIPELELVAEIVPGSMFFEGQGEETAGQQIPRRVTQLTVQQAEVLWVGTWRDPRELEKAQDTALEQSASSTQPIATPTPIPERFETRPDVVILSMTAQDALVLKWALETGINIDLGLRAPGDTTVFATTSVTLPQLVEQGGVIIPQVGQFGLEPPINEVIRPFLPSTPPQ